MLKLDHLGIEVSGMVDRGAAFATPPQSNPWGYGAELVDPDGRLVGRWDAETMNRD